MESDDEHCSVEGCPRRSVCDCELCGKPVCRACRRLVLHMELCWSCALGLTEGLAVAKELDDGD